MRIIAVDCAKPASFLDKAMLEVVEILLMCYTANQEALQSTRRS